MYKLIASYIKKTFPEKWVQIIGQWVQNYQKFILYFYKPYFRLVRFRYIKITEKLQKKDKIKVAFFVLHDSVWKYEGIYKLMVGHEKFDPVIVVCPYVVYGKSNMLKDMDQTFNAFISKGYNVIRTFNKENEKWLDVKKVVKPDIVFFSVPHKVTKKNYYITSYLNCLTCYVPYSFQVSSLYREQFNQPFHNFLWCAFYETEIHKNIAYKFSNNQGKNVIVSGYPGLDSLLNRSNETPSEVWKIHPNIKVKRIIWAPHHTIENEGNGLNYSNFLKYSNFMLELCDNYSNLIQISFKPHPLLFVKLSSDKVWGREKTIEYYKKWKNLNNGQLNESGYEDLFKTSHAMIHDSGSFMVEYSCLNKPSLFSVRDENIEDRFNEFGKMIFNLHYKAYSEADIIEFIDNVVINDKDSIFSHRNKFISSYIIQSTQSNASANIFNEINSFLNKN